MHPIRPALIGLWIVAGVALPVPAQTDDQTKDLLEKERDYFESQMGEDPATEPAATSAAAPDPAEVRAFLEEADRLIHDRNYDMRATAHYRAQTDDPRLIPGQATVLLESFRRFFESFWEGRAALQPYDQEARIFLFYSYLKYNQLLTGNPRFDEFRSSGHYRPYFDVVVIHSDSAGGPAALPDTLVHEAAHQLIARRMYGPRGVEANWISEGLASYFGFTERAASGEFLPGAIGGKGITLLRDEARPSEGSGRDRLAAFRPTIKAAPPAVDALLAIQDPAEYYGEGLQERYTLSWLLIHYLLHGEEGKLAAGFMGYLQADAAGEPAPDVLYQATGRGPEDLSRGLQAYVLGLKTRPAKKK